MWPPTTMLGHMVCHAILPKYMLHALVHVGKLTSSACTSTIIGKLVVSQAELRSKDCYSMLLRMNEPGGNTQMYNHQKFDT